MGVPPVRRIASIALSAALLAGATGPVAFAADSTPERAHTAASAPVPGADKLLAQVNTLGHFGTLLEPVSNLLNTVLKADKGQLSADQATKLVQAAKDAVTKVATSAPASDPMSPPSKTDADAKARADRVSDAKATLTKALDTLQKATTSGDGDQVTGAAHGVLSGLLGLLTSLLGL
ncbi:hypothetical protein BFF78_26970 [Streptomyces fodineus]|uniref:Secreted protein n=1 Tax=Streptomyces fodineus TaxID=1904616 RepID=A0A1D7YFC5_9ACTN|nr:hypothetical protein [Streptomyces fodineus]AOR34210.1 hypothetical protein BFF78_26970 [Streptomyces fodineus]